MLSYACETQDFLPMPRTFSLLTPTSYLAANNIWRTKALQPLPADAHFQSQVSLGKYSGSNSLPAGLAADAGYITFLAPVA